jgi:uncharacterized protein (TIGR03000 family)
MYSMVLMAALTTGTDMPDARRRGGRGGGCCGCYGGMVYGGCYGGGGGCYGGGGGCYGGGGGCYGGGYVMGGYGRGGYVLNGGYGGYNWAGSSMTGYTYSPGVLSFNNGMPLYPGNTTNLNPTTMQSFYYTPGSQGNEAIIVVNLPADATLTVDGERTQSTSGTRVFVSPPLQPGKTFQYTLRAEVNRDGRHETSSKTVDVQAGRTSQVNIEFPGLNPPAERLNPPGSGNRTPNSGRSGID